MTKEMEIRIMAEQDLSIEFSNMTVDFEERGFTAKEQLAEVLELYNLRYVHTEQPSMQPTESQHAAMAYWNVILHSLSKIEELAAEWPEFPGLRDLE